MSKSVLPVRPTATQVRQALGLPDGVRGRLSAADVARYNKGKVAAKRYVPGNTRVAKVEAQAARAALVEQGLAGTRGPLSKATLATLKG